MCFMIHKRLVFISSPWTRVFSVTDDTLHKADHEPLWCRTGLEFSETKLL